MPQLFSQCRIWVYLIGMRSSKSVAARFVLSTKAWPARRGKIGNHAGRPAQGERRTLRRRALSKNEPNHGAGRFRRRRPHRLAYASTGPDTDRYGWLRMGAARRRAHWGTRIRTRINGVRALFVSDFNPAPPHTPRARSPAVGSIASGFIPLSPSEERSALDAHARPGLEKRDTVQSMSRGRPAALGSIMSTLEQRRDQMFPKLRPEEIDRTATAAIERLFFVQKARYCAIPACARRSTGP
jgi:hypothetical protein